MHGFDNFKNEIKARNYDSHSKFSKILEKLDLIPWVKFILLYNDKLRIFYNSKVLKYKRFVFDIILEKYYAINIRQTLSKIL